MKLLNVKLQIYGQIYFDCETKQFEGMLFDKNKKPMLDESIANDDYDLVRDALKQGACQR